MADRPPRRFPASVRQLVSVFERETDAETEQDSTEAPNVRLQPDSEVDLESDSDGSYRSLSQEEFDEDDLLEEDMLDYEEEYQKEIAEQRILDERNGHFISEQLPPTRTTATPEEAAEYLALSLAAFPLHQDMVVDEVRRPCLETVQLHANPGLDVDGSVSDVHATSDVHAAAGLEKGMNDGSARLQFGSYSNVELTEDRGGMYTLSNVEDSLSFDRHMAAAKSTPTLIENSQNHKAATYSSICARNNSQVNNPSLLCMERSAAGFDDLSGEKNTLLDLEESRSLVQQQAISGLQNGPRITGSSPHTAGQVSSSAGPSLFSAQPYQKSQPIPSPNNLQPTHPPNNPQPISHLNSQPKTFSFANSSQPKPNQPKHKHPTHFKKKKNKTPPPRQLQSGSADGKELAAALFSGQKHSSQPKTTPSLRPQPTSVLACSNMEEFPPISGCNMTPAAPTLAEPIRTTSIAAEPPTAIQISHMPITAAMKVNSSPTSWADLMAKEDHLEKGVHGEFSKR